MSKRQSRYKIWANQNKRDNGFTEQPDDLYNSIKTSKQQEYAHPAFNKLFLKSEYLEKTGTILVKRKMGICSLAGSAWEKHCS